MRRTSGTCEFDHIWDSEMPRYVDQSKVKAAEREIRRAKRTLKRIQDDKPLNHDYEKLTVALFARAIKAADAVKLLASSGYAEDALSLLRVVYELCQHVAFINVDWNKRSRRTQVYRMEGILDQYEDAEFIRRAGHLDQYGLTSRFEDLRRECQRIRKEPEFRQGHREHDLREIR